MAVIAFGVRCSILRGYERGGQRESRECRSLPGDSLAALLQGLPCFSSPLKTAVPSVIAMKRDWSLVGQPGSSESQMTGRKVMALLWKNTINSYTVIGAGEDGLQCWFLPCSHFNDFLSRHPVKVVCTSYVEHVVCAVGGQSGPQCFPALNGFSLFVVKPGIGAEDVESI
jgi:hypothetical protein